jgi:hypothetical protein
MNKYTVLYLNEIEGFREELKNRKITINWEMDKNLFEFIKKDEYFNKFEKNVYDSMILTLEPSGTIDFMINSSKNKVMYIDQNYVYINRFEFVRKLRSLK